MSADRDDTDLSLEFGDEHPLFTLIWEQAKTARRQSPLAAVPESPEVVELELRIGDTVQKFGLANVADVSWTQARMRMRTNWIAAKPITVTPAAATNTEEKKL